jgi:hypothetical protein
MKNWVVMMMHGRFLQEKLEKKKEVCHRRGRKGE